LTVDHESQDVRFNHQVFREYFQARAVLEWLSRGDSSRVVNTLSRRPIPEAVAGFVAELGDRSTAQSLFSCLGEQRTSSELLTNNVAAIVQAYRDPDLLQEFLHASDARLPLSLRLQDTRISEVSFSDRIYEDIQFVRCDLSQADFRRSTIQHLALHETSVDGSLFEGVEAHSMTLDFRTRLFGTGPILRLLAERGADCGPDFRKRLESLSRTRRDELHEIVKARLRRFYVPGMMGPEGSRWDTSIKEATLLGGLSPPDRFFVASAVVPEMRRLRLISRQREHGQVIYRLEDEAKDDARKLIENDEEVGRVRALIDRLD
jgi:hypothetical protein